MRNGQNKRMRGRNNRNNNSNNNNTNHNRGHHHNPLTRVYELNGQDVKIRGTAHTVAEKYLQLARDAMTSGDHVTAENHHQHAEHYLRLIATAQEQFRQQNPYYQPQQATPGTDNGDGDGSFDDDDGQPMQGQPAQGQPMQGQPMQGQPMQGQQPPQGHQSNYNNQQPPYPPREQPQPYAGQQPQQTQPQHQNPQQHQPRPQQQQPQPAPFEGTDALPSFITGGQPPQNNPQNGHDNNQSGDRFPLHRRRRRHRGPPQDDTRPGNE